MTETDEPIELPRGVALAWGVAANPQRGPKREMSVERIVDAAVELADAEGLAAVSMAAVAKRLGFTPMSLYRYVSAKDDLLLLMQEEATGLPPEEVHEATGWRAKLEVLYRAQVGIFTRHPWVLSIPITGLPVTPGSSAWMEAGLSALDGTGLDADERMAVVLLTTGLARWNGIVFSGYAAQAHDSGLTPDEIAVREHALLDAVISADGHPRLRDAIDSGVIMSERDPFRFGLERALDGVEAYIARLAKGGERSEPVLAEEDDEGALLADKRYRDARRAVRDAQRALAAARKQERQTAREARERLARKA
ncbi:TetR/AcrR family transcriptional regulator [Microbacterium sp. JZ31]|uniref:TetR/AcrR family transcriptional regulator n=1 Tax=Microbacterium sp. JZ31 TaxID=1906274 RepID=UPI00193249B4|nr:TetR/AcrR family transcriptional regulator [Microbacterium sp. JZ31]